jgi:hypothetical protein
MNDQCTLPEIELSPEEIQAIIEEFFKSLKEALSPYCE